MACKILKSKPRRVHLIGLAGLPFDCFSAEKFSAGKYEGWYLLEDGCLLSAHEWMDSDPEWDEDPEICGAVYYSIVSTVPQSIGEETDGGVMGYGRDTTFADFNAFLTECNQPCITDRLVERCEP